MSHKLFCFIFSHLCRHLNINCKSFGNFMSASFRIGIAFFSTFLKCVKSITKVTQYIAEYLLSKDRTIRLFQYSLLTTPYFHFCFLMCFIKDIQSHLLCLKLSIINFWFYLLEMYSSCS